MIAKAPSQAHLQGTQCRHTKANLAKELILFLRFLGHTQVIGHIMQVDTPRQRANVQHGVWQKWRFNPPQTHLWLIKHLIFASTFVVKIATFAKPPHVSCIYKKILRGLFIASKAVDTPSVFQSILVLLII